MRLYLTRVTQLVAVWPIRRLWNSEGFLRATALEASAEPYAVQERADWMFCQFGDRKGVHKDDQECTARLRLALRCEQFSCGWCEGGCHCWNTSCAPPSQPDSLLLKRNRWPLCYEFGRKATSPIIPRRDPDKFVRGQLFVGGGRS